jgi:hypothetical protein
VPLFPLSVCSWGFLLAEPTRKPDGRVVLRTVQDSEGSARAARRDLGIWLGVTCNPVLYFVFFCGSGDGT